MGRRTFGMVGQVLDSLGVSLVTPKHKCAVETQCVIGKQKVF